jgi:hypothetical protein
VLRQRSTCSRRFALSEFECILKHRHALQAQQFPFHLQAATVAGERAVRADDAMTGNDDGHRVAMIGLSNRARCSGKAHGASQFRVTAGCSIWNPLQGLPAANLKRRAPQIEVTVKLPKFPLKISSQLLFTMAQALRSFHPEFVFGRRRQGAAQLQATQTSFRCGEQQFADGGFDARVIKGLNHRKMLTGKGGPAESL